MDLENKIWQSLNGGYKMPYDASAELKNLRSAVDKTEIEIIFAELWKNLHHQGDVGLASYLSVPQLVAICIEKNSLNWNFIALPVLIELCRLNDNNPPLPDEFRAVYFDALKTFEQYLLSRFKNIKDADALRCTLALFALMNGEVKLGKAIHLLDEDLIAEFIEQNG